jgi:2-polyprenyl-6-hydroxyphenyl methylase/3-demethylubiquinone-9 3-methyltransferase
MSARKEIEQGARFGFGENWARFLGTLDDRGVESAERSLTEALGERSLADLRFLDIGSGSGLFSLAARRLGARVHSFDFDPDSVACTRELKRRYFPDDTQWTIEEGSVLDRQYVDRLGRFDVVYSWGVLHHTGAMWSAIEHAIRCVDPSAGRFVIAIYNDQGWKSHVWWLIKSAYNGMPRGLRAPFAFAVSTLTRSAAFAKSVGSRTARRGQSKPGRGMNAKYDEIDWIGGFPFEFASLETLQSYLGARGFEVVHCVRTAGWGCNELTLRRVDRCAD